MDSPFLGPGLRGRADECAVLDGLIDDIRRGESRSLVLRGEAGIGKSALLEYLVESASGTTVVCPRPYRSRPPLPVAGTTHRRSHVYREHH